MSAVLALAVGLGTLAAVEAVSIWIHEAGHVTAARLCGVRLTGFALGARGLGVRLGRDDVLLAPRTRVLIALGGPAASTLLMVAAARAGLPRLALGALIITLLNLIPFKFSDGQAVWREIRPVSRFDRKSSNEAPGTGRKGGQR